MGVSRKRVPLGMTDTRFQDALRDSGDRDLPRSKVDHEGVPEPGRIRDRHSLWLCGACAQVSNEKFDDQVSW